MENKRKFNRNLTTRFMLYSFRHRNGSRGKSQVNLTSASLFKKSSFTKQRKQAKERSKRRPGSRKKIKNTTATTLCLLASVFLPSLYFATNCSNYQRDHHSL